MCNNSLLSKLVSLRAKRSNLIVKRLLRRFAPRNDTLLVFQKHSSDDNECHNLKTSDNNSFIYPDVRILSNSGFREPARYSVRA